MIPLGERHFQNTLDELVEHSHRERNHQGLNNELIDGQPSQSTLAGFAVVSDSAGCSTTTTGARPDAPTVASVDLRDISGQRARARDTSWQSGSTPTSRWASETTTHEQREEPGFRIRLRLEPTADMSEAYMREQSTIAL